MRKFLLILPLFIPLFFAGCAYKSTNSEIARFDDILYENRCDFSLVDKKLKNGDDVILWSIQGAALARNCGDFKKSTQLFDEAELHYKLDVDLKNPLLSARDTTRSMLINNNANPYEGNVYEKTLVNTYKALNFLALNDKENARVELNRALERQRIAVEYFAKDIASLESKNAKSLQELKNSQELYNSAARRSASRKDKRSTPAPISFNENSIDAALNKYSQSVEGVVYPDFINPFATYISALFFLNDRSYQRAADLFKESLQINPKNPQIAKDFALADKMAGEFNANFKERYVWLIYENGLGAVKAEFRIDLPIFLISNSFLYTGIALPKLQFRNGSYRYLTIKNRSGDSFDTSLIANMDSVEAAEFDKRYFGIAMEAIISAAAKTVLQKQMNDIDPILGLLSLFYQVGTAKADVRGWSALPKYFMAASIPIKDGDISIIDENGVILLNEFLQNDR
ncbi:MAG: hypothetical protein LBS73_07295, partial [Campylobacteraceae bacterium]|nr:hypothetical protein [Campylobacteraceae bacterium]